MVNCSAEHDCTGISKLFPGALKRIDHAVVPLVNEQSAVYSPRAEAVVPEILEPRPIDVVSEYAIINIREVALSKSGNNVYRDTRCPKEIAYISIVRPPRCRSQANESGPSGLSCAKFVQQL